MKTKHNLTPSAAEAKNSDQLANRARPTRGRWLAVSLGGLLLVSVCVDDVRAGFHLAFKLSLDFPVWLSIVYSEVSITIAATVFVPSFV